MESDRRTFLAAGAAALAWGCGQARSMSPTRPVASGERGSTAVPPAVAAEVPARIRLAANENPYGPSPRARAAAQAALGEACRYSESCGELAAALAARHGVSSEHVVLGTGSFAILMWTVDAAMRPGGAAVVAHPSFDVVGDRAATFGSVSRVPLDARFGLDLDAMAAAITASTRLVYVCNPNNPTSTVVDGAELAAFCKRFAQRTLVLVDEAYAEYVADLASMDALVRDGVPIVVARTFSKLFGLAGLRVGYAIAPPPIAERLRSARGVADRAWVAAPAARAAIASLSDADYVARTRREVGEVRTRFVGALEHLGLVVPAPRANFVYFEHARIDALVAGMAARGIRIGSLAQPRACRITIGLPSEMTAAADALAAVLPTLR